MHRYLQMGANQNFVHGRGKNQLNLQNAYHLSARNVFSSDVYLKT
jgi:hypothetical protein